MNRESWLDTAVKRLAEIFFLPRKYDLPEKLRVSCGWSKGATKNAIGWCWSEQNAADGSTHMFISPSLDSPVVVLATLLHEMVHAHLGVKEAHGKKFRAMVKEFGLAGKPTATYAAEDSDLFVTLTDLSRELGAYPHAKLVATKKLAPKREGWLRFKSVGIPEYRVVVSPKMVEAYGAPRDPNGDEMVVLDK